MGGCGPLPQAFGFDVSDREQAESQAARGVDPTLPLHGPHNGGTLTPVASGRSARFGPFQLDLSTGELRRHDRKLNLQNRSFQILTLLLERKGELVTRDEIRAKVWSSDTVVEFEHSIATAVNKLRQALGDDANRPRYVETLPRRGYRWLGPGSWDGRPAAPGSSRPVPFPPTPARPLGRTGPPATPPET